MIELHRCRICGAEIQKEGICESCKRSGGRIGSFDRMFEEIGEKFGKGQSIRIQQGPEGTRIDVSGDVDVDKLKRKYGKDAEIYKNGKRVDKPLIEVIEEEEEAED